MAQDYVEAYARRDLPALRNYVATEPSHLFGPYPFVRIPQLARPKVDGRQALVEFVGTAKPNAPVARGGLLCYREKGVWKVRQVLFYEKAPRVLQLPKGSKTAKDREQEGAVEALAKCFLSAWERGDTAALAAQWYDWTKRSDRPIKGLTTHDTKVTVAAPKGAEAPAVASYFVGLTYHWGPLHYSMDFNGDLFLVREGGAWKVCGNLMAFRF